MTKSYNNFSAFIWYFHINLIFWYLHMVWLASSLYGNIYYCRTCFLQIFSDSRLNTPKMKKWRNRDNVSAFIWSSNVNLIFLLHAWPVKPVHFLVIFTTVGPVFLRFFRFSVQYPGKWKNDKIIIISLLLLDFSTSIWFFCYLHMVWLASSLFGDSTTVGPIFFRFFRFSAQYPKDWKKTIMIISLLAHNP